MTEPADDQEFDVIVHPLDDGGFWAEVDGLPGCLTQASSYTEILGRVRDAHDSCLVALPVGGPPVRLPPLEEIRTAGQLASVLAAAGWQVAAQGSHHTVFAGSGRPERISVPSDPEIPLNEGYQRGLGKLFS